MTKYNIMEIDIKGVAKRHGVTINDIAARLGVSRQTVHYYTEQGDRLPVAQLVRIAEAIGCELAELLDEGKNVIRCPHCGALLELKEK